METLTRLVSQSLARHGFDRPVDYRRLQWSRWFRCESHHSLLVVPSKPGVFALAEEIMTTGATTHAETAASPALSSVERAVPQTLNAANGGGTVTGVRHTVEERRFSAASGAQMEAALAAVAPKAECREPNADSAHRMLAVTQFFEDDDMAFVLDRMLSHENPMRARLVSGRHFVRFVEIQDQAQRRSICSALNQWIISSAEKATGIGSHFSTSLELTPGAEPTHVETAASAVPRRVASGTDDLNPKQCGDAKAATAPPLNSAVATTIHCSSSFPSGF